MAPRIGSDSVGHAATTRAKAGSGRSFGASLHPALHPSGSTARKALFSRGLPVPSTALLRLQQKRFLTQHLSENEITHRSWNITQTFGITAMFESKLAAAGIIDRFSLFQLPRNHRQNANRKSGAFARVGTCMTKAVGSQCSSPFHPQSM
jgi:hypothetical protein